jgi:hypothetical protein
MANFRASTGALSNLFIGLARGYWKERRRIQKRFKGKVRQERDAVIKLEDGFVEDMTNSCSDYFCEYDIKDIANSIMHACDRFEEQRKK